MALFAAWVRGCAPPPLAGPEGTPPPRPPERNVDSASAPAGHACVASAMHWLLGCRKQRHNLDRAYRCRRGMTAYGWAEMASYAGRVLVLQLYFFCRIGLVET